MGVMASFYAQKQMFYFLFVFSFIRTDNGTVDCG